MFYETKVKVTRINRHGKEAEVKESYLVNCLLFAEAEVAMMELFNNECDVFSISRSNIMEIINKANEDENESYFKAKLIEISIDDNGNEKELAYYVLVAAKDVKQATERTLEYMRQGLENTRLDAINKTKILDILKDK